MKLLLILYSIYFHLIKTFLTILSSTLVVICAFILIPFRKARHLTGYYLGKFWGSSILFFSFLRVKITYTKPLDLSQNLIFVANHQSAFDIYLFYAYLPKKFYWIAKKSLLYVPFLGQAMYLQGHVFVERDDSNKAAIALRKTIEQCKQGISIAIFPEGKRSIDGNLQPFKKGAFALARLSQKNIVPIVIKNIHKVAPPKRFIVDPRPIVTLVFKEIVPGKDKNCEETIRNIMHKELDLK